ncbi:hypothetical protein ACN28I_27770 [Archangium gephyra]|uniref:hypothetical protein n=1 Tax=Archangium gephyra TaxID=48 RepID=UPI003B7BB5F2
MASRLFPMPPGPSNVTSRASVSKPRRSAASSSCRPISSPVSPGTWPRSTRCTRSASKRRSANAGGSTSISVTASSIPWRWYSPSACTTGRPSDSSASSTRAQAVPLTSTCPPWPADATRAVSFTTRPK